MQIPNKVYDILKWCVLVCLPALAVAYTALSKVWSWPLAEEVSMSVNAVCSLLGALIGISTAEYYRGK